MSYKRNVATLGPTDMADGRPVTDPSHIVSDVNSLRYMVDQLVMYLEKAQPDAEAERPITVRKPRRGRWVYRLVIARPGQLARDGAVTLVGFLGQKRSGAAPSRVNAFDRTLVGRIPEHPGLLSYSSMALISGNYSNLVLFADEEAKAVWSRSEAHNEAVAALAPHYYRSVRLYNGVLPQGIYHSPRMQVTKVKYFDYEHKPFWRGVRELPEA